MSPTRFEFGSSSSKHKIGTKEKMGSKAQGNEQGRGKRLRKSQIGSTISGEDITERTRNLAAIEKEVDAIEGLTLTSGSFQPEKRRRRLILYESDDEEEPTPSKQKNELELSVNLETQLARLDRSIENLTRRLESRREPSSSALQISVFPPSPSPSPLPLVDTDVYRLEYMSSEDEAWYDISLSLDAVNETLTVKHSCFPATDDVVFSTGDFRTLAQLKKLLARFRPTSRLLQDNECNLLSVGTSVCASYTVGDDIRYYDAIVKKVERNTHSHADGEEVCLCKFVLCWKHGCSRGSLSPAKLVGICVLEPAIQLHPTLHAFGEMVKKKLVSSENTQQILESTMQLRSITFETEGSGMNSRYVDDSATTDMGYNSRNADDSATTDGRFVILLNNLETSLTPSSIQNFIFEKTALLPEVCIFTRRPSQPFGRGAIMVDCSKKAQTIHEFLVNPNHLVVSSRGRPWVVKEILPGRTNGADYLNLIPARQAETIPIRTRRELEVVMSGSESYRRAEQIRSLFAEYLYHDSQVLVKLALEENKILGSSQQPS